jgi:hypothetical protein
MLRKPINVEPSHILGKKKGNKKKQNQISKEELLKQMEAEKQELMKEIAELNEDFIRMKPLGLKVASNIVEDELAQDKEELEEMEEKEKEIKLSDKESYEF